jgi:putative DNA-invertase from lambdoid prophage Rac
MPTVYCYGRASTDKQAVTEDAQRSACEEYVDRSLKPQGYTYGGWMYDPATSGSTQMFEREQGRNLWALVQPGDRIVWAKLDRAFRSSYDFVHTMMLLQAKGVSFTSLDIGLDSGTPIGRCVFTIMAAFAELEREFIRERTRNGLGQKRRSGKPINPHAPIGWKKVGTKKDSYYLPDPAERAQVDRMVVMRRDGKSLERITLAFWGERRTNGHRWNINSITRALKAAAARYPKEFQAPPKRRRAAV